MSNYKLLEQKCYKALNNKNINTEKYIKRLQYELFVIKTLGFVDYFLILADILNWAQKNNILTGLARGSAGGSLISYLLGITNIDPIKWGLPFERFLNPGRAGTIEYDFELPQIKIINEEFNFIEWYNRNKLYNENFNSLEEELGRIELSQHLKYQIRYMFDNNIKVQSNYSGVLYNLGLNTIKPTKDLVIKGGSAPDIDSDVPRADRHRIIDYIKEKYGEDKVALVSAFSLAKSRQCIRDAGRALNKEYLEYDKLSKKIPLGKTIMDMVEENDEFKKLYEKRDELLMTAIGIENTLNAVSTHAAGVIISKEPLIEHLPLIVVHDKKHKHSYNLTAWDKDQCEEIGLLKLDLLGLKTLDILAMAYKFIQKKNNNKRYNVNDLYNIPLDDKDTFEYINKGNTTGVFQLSSNGMTELLLNLKPKNIDDLALLVALYRPGPLESGMVDDLLDARNGVKPRVHIHPDIDYIFDNTYGIMVYQEQLMEMLQVLAGYSLAEADKARKGFAKKNQELFNKVLKDVLERMDTRGYSDLKDKIADMLKGVARYLFNKSHSYAYGILAYYTAYYKTHYTLEYSASLLEITDTPDEFQELIMRLNSEGIKILPPSIRYSQKDNTPDYKNNAIRLGFKIVKGVSRKASASLEKAKKKKIDKFEDFVSFAIHNDINAKDLKALIMLGIFDDIIINRRYAVETLPDLIKHLKQIDTAKLKLEEWKIKLAKQYELKTQPWEIHYKNNKKKYLNKDISKEEIKYEKKRLKFLQEFPTVDDFINNNKNYINWKSKLNSEFKIDQKIEDYTDIEKFKMEKELLGIYLQRTPLDKYYAKFKHMTITKDDFEELNNKEEVYVLAYIEDIKTLKTKKNKEFYVLNAYIPGGFIEITVWEKELIDKIIEFNYTVMIKGNINVYNGNKKIVLRDVLNLDDIKIDKSYSYAIIDILKEPIVTKLSNGIRLLYKYKIGNYLVYFDSKKYISYQEAKKLNAELV